MARQKRLGSVAAEVFSYGDVDTMISGDTHFEMLAAHEAMEKHQVREATERFVGRLRLHRERLAATLRERALRRREAEEDAADRLAVVQRWRDVGIRERITLRSIPRSAKWFLWALICSLDFYIFAQVMAYAENIADPGLTDGTFWLGGAVGVMVFIVGILLAQAIRRGTLFHAQRKLLKELNKANEDITGLRLSSYSRWMTLSFAVFYIFFTAGAVVLRYQGGGREQPGLLLLQTMIPIVGVMLELLIDDPTEVRLPQRTIYDWWLSRRIGRLDVKIALREMIADEREASVADRYRFERAALENLHNSHGIVTSPEARALTGSPAVASQEQLPEISVPSTASENDDSSVHAAPSSVIVADPETSEPVLIDDAGTEPAPSETNTNVEESLNPTDVTNVR